MYIIDTISPLKLSLDEKNPRFRISINPSQEDIRLYMLNHENILRLANKMIEMNTILPGERIIVCKENKKNIVLEGNRRTTIYQMLLNRDLIPPEFCIAFPVPRKEFLEEIKKIQIDVVPDRESSMKFLAARHIEGVEKWSSVSKWRIAYELFKDGKKISDISEYLALPTSQINTFIYNYTLLLRAIQNDLFSEKEKENLSPLTLEPDKFIRIFKLLTKSLEITRNSSFHAVSGFISSKVLDEIIVMLARKAFIERTVDTRTTFADVTADIELILKKNKIHRKNSDTTNNAPSVQNDPQEEKVDSQNIADNNGDENDTSESGTGSKRNLPYFFSGLKFAHIKNTDPDGFGVVRVCCELKKMSNSTTHYIANFPIATAMLIRSLIENALVYHAKKQCTKSGQPLLQFIEDHNKNIKKLSSIIDKYVKEGENFIPDINVNQYFQALFGDKRTDVTSHLNWVVHRPHEFVIDPTILLRLPDQGLLAIINYLIR
jgi:hypothetical protein